MQHHAAGLLALTHDGQLVAALTQDYRNASINEADRAMLDYVAKLTRSPQRCNQGDVAQLRIHGFSERAVLDVCQVAAYYAFVNRIALGMGVELESRPARQTARSS